MDIASRIPLTIISLILVGALAYLILKFMGGKNLLPNGQGKTVKIIERQFLSAKHCLYVIKALDQYLLIGVSENSVSVLKELNAEEVEKVLCRKPQPQKIDAKGYWKNFFLNKIPK